MARSSAVVAPQVQLGGARDDAILHGRTMVLAVVALALANFMVMLDMTIANVSVPHIAGGLAVSPSQGTWVITSYVVAEAIIVPLAGWLAARFGATRVFITCISLFGLCSLLCGLAPSLGALIIFRILQGLSGGPIMPLSQTLLQRLVPPHLRAQTMSIWATTTVVAPVVGPVLGGAISDGLGWPWVFFINVPVAMLLVALALRTLPLREMTQRLPVDFVGLGMLVIWVGALQIMLDKGGELGWFDSPIVVGLLILAVVGFLAFLIWELTDEHPIVDLRIFRHRDFAISCVAMSLTFAGLFSANLLIPLWLQTNQGYTAYWAGMVTGFNGVLAVIAAPFCARLVIRVDPRHLVSISIVWIAFVMVWRSTLTPGLSFQQLVLPQLAMGLAMPFFYVGLMNLAMASLAPAELAGGAGLLNFARTTAGAFGASLTTTAWTNSALVTHNTFVGRLNDLDGLVESFRSAGLERDQALGLIDSLIQNQAVMLSTNQIFRALAILMVVAVGITWLAPKSTRSPSRSP